MAFGNPFDTIIAARQARDRQKMEQANQLSQTIGTAFGNVIEGQQKGRVKQKWEQDIDKVMADATTPDAVKHVLPFIRSHPEYAGQLLPGVLKQGTGMALTVNPDGTMEIAGVPVPGHDAPKTPGIPAPTTTPTFAPPPVPMGQQMTPVPPPVNDLPMTPVPPPMDFLAPPPTQTSPALPPLPPPTTPLRTKKTMIPLTGNKAAELLLKGAGTEPTEQQKLRKMFLEQFKVRNEIMSRALDARQINNLAKITGLQPTMIKSLQQNNVRADRALGILDDPKSNWQALNGWVGTDFAGMMQGGAPQKDQMLENKFPNWRAQLGQIQTYLSSEPEGVVPQGFRDYMRHFVQGVKDIDNQYLLDNAKYQAGMIAPTISGGGVTQAKQSLDYTKKFMEGGKPLSEQPSNGGWSYVGPAQ